MEQRKAISFKGQNIYVGIDVHLKSWSVTILSETSVLKRMNQGADPDALHRFLTNHYPEAEYYSVYEAGFCGFWIHDRLTELGIHNIVVNPADVPTTSSEKLRKTDAVDSRKLAVSLRARQLKGIYTPDSDALEIRSLIRLKNSITKDMTRQKNRIKSHLRYLGRSIRESTGGEFLHLLPQGAFVPNPIKPGRSGRATRIPQSGSLLSIELRTPNGTMMRIQGEMSGKLLQEFSDNFLESMVRDHNVLIQSQIAYFTPLVRLG